MNRVLKWAGYGLAGVMGACALAVGGAFAVSEAMIRWPVERPQVTLVASSDPGAVARGKRVATLNGCHDCHGKDLRGQFFHDEKPRSGLLLGFTGFPVQAMDAGVARLAAVLGG